MENVDTLVSKMEEKKQLIDESIADAAIEGSAAAKKSLVSPYAFCIFSNVETRKCQSKPSTSSRRHR